MAYLIEDVLHHIFNYLPPLDLINTSKVCRLWKLAASRGWTKITEISYLNHDLSKKVNDADKNNAPVISTKDLKRITYHAAPFVNILIASTRSIVGDQFVLFGPFLYKVVDFNDAAILNLLAENATNISEICFDYPPKPETLNLLIERNKVEKVKVAARYEMNLDKPKDQLEGSSRTSKVDEFRLNLTYYAKLFVKRMWLREQQQDLEIDCEVSYEPQGLVSSMPYSYGVESFRLHIKSLSKYCPEHLIFGDIVEYTRIHSLLFDSTKRIRRVEGVSEFLKLLEASCPNLRAIQFVGLQIRIGYIFSLLNFSKLERLEIDFIDGWDPINQPAKMVNLSELKLKFNNKNFYVTIFCNILTNMPKLKSLRMDEYCFPRKNYDGIEEFLLYLIQGVTKVMESQRKGIVLEIVYKHDMLKMCVKQPVHDETQMLNFLITLNAETHSFERVKRFLEDNLETD